MNTKVIIIASSVIAALLVVVAIVGVVLLNTLNAQAENERYQDCMARQGFPVEQPAGVNSDDELDAYISDAVEAAEFCSR